MYISNLNLEKMVSKYFLSLNILLLTTLFNFKCGMDHKDVWVSKIDSSFYFKESNYNISSLKSFKPVIDSFEFKKDPSIGTQLYIYTTDSTDLRNKYKVLSVFEKNNSASLYSFKEIDTIPLQLTNNYAKKQFRLRYDLYTSHISDNYLVSHLLDTLYYIQKY